jgi:hypothetical protein
MPTLTTIWAAGAAAGEQEAALRSLLRARPETSVDGRVDLADELIALRQDGVTVSGPGEPVVLERLDDQVHVTVREDGRA